MKNHETAALRDHLALGISGAVVFGRRFCIENAVSATRVIGTSYGQGRRNDLTVFHMKIFSGRTG
jgi:hypothetical protein